MKIVRLLSALLFAATLTGCCCCVPIPQGAAPTAAPRSEAWQPDTPQSAPAVSRPEPIAWSPPATSRDAEPVSVPASLPVRAATRPPVPDAALPPVPAMQAPLAPAQVSEVASQVVAPETPATIAPRWLPASSRIYPGVTFYVGTGNDKEAFGVAYEVDTQGERVSVITVHGNVRWYPRRQITMSGYWFVRSDDPVLLRY